ncbi:hypothetical protein BDV06DRAFT_219523 [Aspergillus oleicola]
MDYLSRLWTLVLSSPHVMARLFGFREGYRDNYRRAQRRVDSLRRAVVILEHVRHPTRVDGALLTEKENNDLREDVAKMQRKCTEDTEKIELLHELQQQTRQETMESEERHQNEMNALYAKLNGAQGGPKRLTDEQIRDQMRLLLHHLESWVTKNFRDAAKLESVAGSQVFPTTSPQRRAWIQAHVTHMVFCWIFAPPRFGPNNQANTVNADLEAGIQRTYSEAIFTSWKYATGTAIENMRSGLHRPTFDRIIKCIEDPFGSASSTEEEPRKLQLRKLLEKCATLKATLSREPDVFVFLSSAIGADFPRDTMACIGADQESAGKVGLSLWPGLYKCPYVGPSTSIERELVWKTDWKCDKIADGYPSNVGSEATKSG